MAQDYGSIEDVQLRIGRSICLYKGEPVYVSCDYQSYPNVQIQHIVAKYGVVSKGAKVIDHRDPDLDDRAFDLGYMQYDDRAYYLKRGAFRHQNQGLRAENIISVPYLSRGSFIFTGGMHSCIMGTHPTLKEAFGQLDKGALGVPIHRHVAIQRMDSRHVGLYYRARLVAMWQEAKGEWNWLESFDQKHIKRLVEKTGCLGT